MAKERKKPTIEELEAILNDPTPQKIQLLPDGSICAVPDEGAELVKQARSEVLATLSEAQSVIADARAILGHGACLSCQCEGCATEHNTASANLTEYLEGYPLVDEQTRIFVEKDLLLKVTDKPAASDLEELLREAELKGLKLDHIQHGIIDNSCRRCSRIAELENELKKRS